MTVTGVAKMRIAELVQLTARVFGHVYNPTGVRTGNKVLRKRLIGPTITSYYPQDYGRESSILKMVSSKFPELGLVNLEEQERLEQVERRRRRGKGPPKKGKQMAVCPFSLLIIAITYPLLLLRLLLLLLGQGKRAQLGKKKKK
jgi:hypothetical protein